MPKSKKTLKREADTLWSEIIRDAGECVRCQRKDIKLEAAHIYSRRNLSTRYDLNNGLCLCTGCHFWAHQNPIDFAEWVDKYLGEGSLQELKDKAKKPVRNFDFEKTVIYLQDIWDRLQ